jgi:hypothetical protein
MLFVMENGEADGLPSIPFASSSLHFEPRVSLKNHPDFFNKNPAAFSLTPTCEESHIQKYSIITNSSVQLPVI